MTQNHTQLVPHGEYLSPQKVKEKLTLMEQREITSKVDEPIEWCARLVVIPKAHGKVWICVDLTKLNESILTWYHPLPSVHHTLAQLPGATIFSKRDANSRFWQIGLSPESAKLTTFITPFGSFCFNRKPFGISSAPEHFQKWILQLLEGTFGALCQMDDILVYSKCEFLGTLIDFEGVHVSLKKVEAILKMKTSQDPTEFRRFLGMVNQLSKFQPQLAELSKQPRDLMSSKSHRLWSDANQQAFTALKESLASTPTLAHYDASRQTKLCSDASSYGLGGVLMQLQYEGEWRPVAKASRATSPTKQHNTQIEKEALGSTWASERFTNYLTGLKFHI